MFQEIYSTSSWVYALSHLRGKEDERVWEEQLFKTGKHFWLKETLEFVPLYLFPFEFFFKLMYLKEDYLKVLCCTRTINTVFSMILWKKISLEYCLPNQRFNFNMLFFPIVWREISEKILHVFSLLLLESPESPGICRFFSGVISLVPIWIPHQYSYITYKRAFYVMMPFLFFFS